ncbi:MAG: RNA polymerase sigma factor WhiG, partial [Deltaproteobacteria bacterium]|nr:RNA polymerase sigma factor WhiG [Deltaproteobacteria bacterium]
MARRIARRLPRSIEVDDLVGAGTEGLMRAIAAYDSDRGHMFEPYAEARIRGAILDELRAGDSVTQYARR